MTRSVARMLGQVTESYRFEADRPGEDQGGAGYQPTTALESNEPANKCVVLLPARMSGACALSL